MPDQPDIDQQLQGMASDASTQARLGSASDIRRRAGRRRAIQVGATAAATVLVVAGAWAVAAPGGDDAGIPPAGQTGTPTTPDRGGASETTAPTQPGESTRPSVPDLPPQSPGPTGGPPPAELSPQQPPAGGWETSLPRPRAIVLPHDLDVAQHSEESDWQEVSGQADWLLLPCDAANDVGYPSDGSRTAHAVIGQSGIESFRGEQVAVYPSDVEAMQAMRDLLGGLEECQDERTVRRGETSSEQTYTDSYWGWREATDVTSAGTLAPDEAFQAWNWNRTFLWDGSPQYGLGGGFYTVVRVGNAIFMTVPSSASSHSVCSFARPKQPSPTTSRNCGINCRTSLTA